MKTKNMTLSQIVFLQKGQQGLHEVQYRFFDYCLFYMEDAQVPLSGTAT